MRWIKLRLFGGPALQPASAGLPIRKKTLTRALVLPGGATSTSARCLKSRYLFGFLRFLELACSSATGAGMSFRRHRFGWAPSSSPPPSPARRLLAWRRPVGISGPPGRTGELGRTLHFAKVPKREKAEVPAVFAATKTRSPPATSRAANAAEAPVFPGQTTPPRQSWVGAH